MIKDITLLVLTMLPTICLSIGLKLVEWYACFWLISYFGWI